MYQMQGTFSCPGMCSPPYESYCVQIAGNIRTMRFVHLRYLNLFKSRIFQADCEGTGRDSLILGSAGGTTVGEHSGW